MKPPPSLLTFLFTILLLLTSTTAANSSTTSPPTAAPALADTPPTAAPTLSPIPKTSSSPLDPDQIKALKSLHIPTKNPCDQKATRCDAGVQYRHLISLHLVECKRSTALTSTALKYLSTLQDLQLINCPTKPVRMPSKLASNLRTFACINSFKKVSGVWLSRFRNLTDLNISGCNITASGPYVIIGNMKQLTSLTVSNANLSGNVPKYMNEKLTHIDLSDNNLKGKIHSNIGLLENLVYLNLSSNGLDGEIPYEIGDLFSLKTLSLSSNSLSGSIPKSLSAIPGLTYLDLSSNQLNGTVPKWIADLKSLKHLNLAGNNFHGVFPFNASFIKKLEVFKVGDNSNLCYNHTVLSSKLKLGIARCDKYGMPLSPPPPKEDSSDSSDYEASEEDTRTKEEKHNGPNKVVLGVAIGLASLVFLIVFLICLAKKCG